MNEGLISRRYAKALYEHAKKLGEEHALYLRLQTLSAEIGTIGRFRETLNSPMIPAKYKRKLLETATGNTPERSYIDFVRIIATNNREKYIQDISLSYQDLYRRKKNISVVNITSVTAISDESLARIKRMVTHKTHGEVEFVIHTDQSLGGGFIFQINDMRLDASVRGQLKNIQRRLEMA